ncbi:hypothetical protein HKCCE3408_05685 [Rhodobacterales bacterium HKCCE3408]|nr:hypothetical protein [Rhodobacterales bacterium HKCCE3408]
MDDRTHKRPNEAESEAALARFSEKWAGLLQHYDERGLVALQFVIARLTAEKFGAAQAIEELLEIAETIGREAGLPIERSKPRPN